MPWVCVLLLPNKGGAGSLPHWLSCSQGWSRNGSRQLGGTLGPALACLPDLRRLSWAALESRDVLAQGTHMSQEWGSPASLRPSQGPKQERPFQEGHRWLLGRERAPWGWWAGWHPVPSGGRGRLVSRTHSWAAGLGEPSCVRSFILPAHLFSEPLKQPL